MLAAQPLDFALLSFQLFEISLSLIPRFGLQYKRKLRRSRRSDGGSERITAKQIRLPLAWRQSSEFFSVHD
jgi:hypothetical protein